MNILGNQADNTLLQISRIFKIAPAILAHLIDGLEKKFKEKIFLQKNDFLGVVCTEVFHKYPQIRNQL